MNAITTKTSPRANDADMRLARQHEAELLASARWAWGDDNSHKATLPAPVLEAIDAELTQALAPSGDSRFAAKAAVLLVGSWPTRGPNTPEIYLESMTAAIADYPADIAQSAIKKLIRSNTYLPAVAEFVAAAEEAMGQRRVMLAGARRQMRELKLRAEEEARQRRLDDEYRARLVALHARVVEKFGHEAPPLDSYGAALKTIGKVQRSALPWMNGVNALAPWAITAWRRAAILAEAVDLEEAGKLGFLQVLAIARHLGDGDEAAASAMLGKVKAGEIEADTTPPDLVTEGPDTVSRGPGWNDVWSAVWHVFGPDAAAARVWA